MPFDPHKLQMAATRSDVADFMLSTMGSLLNIRFALDKLNDDGGLDEEIKSLKSEYEALSKKFNEYTGWRASE